MAKRKKGKKLDESVLQELGGWKLGDLVWGIRPNKDIVRGEITKLFESENVAQIWCMIGGGYLICEIGTLEENSTKSKMRKKAKEYIIGG